MDAWHIVMMNTSHTAPLGQRSRRSVSLLSRVMNFVLPRLRSLDRRMIRPEADIGELRAHQTKVAEGCQAGQAADLRAIANRTPPDTH